MTRTKTAMGRNMILMVVGLSLAALAQAYTHPCIPATTQDLDYIKDNLDKEPWKTGYAQLLATWNPDYVPVAYETVSRSPNVNLGAWAGSMGIVYNYARLWYFTGNNAYAQKAHDILLAWANTQTSFGGNEAGLALGDAAFAYGGGASILRGTWPGWTADDTNAVKNLFLNVYWPATANAWHLAGPANKGSINMSAGIAIALFCDDTAKFDSVLDMYRTYPGSGLPNTLPTGEMGETGRDAGHAYGDLLGKAFIAECAWKQGIDLFSEMDNRILAVGEYYCRNIFTLDNPFVHYGTVDWLYFENAEGPYGANRAAMYIIQNAYKNRKGIPTPWIDRKIEEQWVDINNFMYAKTADFTTATPPAANVRPAVSLASSGLTLTTLGPNTAGRSSSYADGVWTMTGLGVDVWGEGNDDCQFAYQEMTGDCAMVARVTSVQAVNASTKAGVMIRDNLFPAVSQRAYAAMMPTNPHQYQSRLVGSTENWAGRVAQTYTPPPGMPYWVKVERRGNFITTYSSQDGTSWSPTVCSYFGNLPSTTYIGLFIASGSATTATTATFDNVAFTGGTGGLVTTPAPPLALIATAAPTANFAVTVRWLPSFGATAYDLLRSTSINSGYTVLAGNLTGTSYVDSSVSAGTNYYYRVRAKNSAGTSGDSMTFGGSHSLLIAPMAYLAVGGTSSASANSGSGGEGSDKAFDRNPGSKWFNNNAAPTGWIQYDLGAGNEQVVKRYTVSSANDVPGRDPKDWSFLGSQDGTNWTTLDSQSNQSFANRYQMNTYDIGNTTAYRYYRLNITANNGEVGLQLSELGLWGDIGDTTPPAAPTGLTAAAGDGSVSLNWADNTEPDLAGYNVYRDTAPGLPYTLIALGIPTSAYTDNTVTNGTTYYYVVTAVDMSSNESAENSNEASATPQAAGQSPYGGTPWAIPGSIEAEDYDTGGEGVAWHDTTAGNSGGLYRSDDVDVESCGEGGYNIGYGANGEWQEYTVNVSSAGTYDIIVRCASTNANGRFHVEFDGVDVTGVQSVPNTGAWQTYTDVTISDVSLNAGQQVMRVFMDVGNWNFNYITLVDSTPDTTPPAAPTGLVATAGDGSVSLDWADNTEPDLMHYDVYRSTTSGSGYASIYSGQTTSDYVDNGVTNGTTYYYVVTATDTSSNESGYSAEASATPTAPGGPEVVFSDSFENGQWNGLWTQDSQNDWFASTQRFVDGSYSAEVDGSATDAALTSILIDLQGNSNATVTFSWLIESGLDSGEYLAFDVSTNGGSNWTQMVSLQGNVDQENTWHNESIDVTGIGSGNLVIRFRGNMSRSNEDADVDMVEVTAW